MKKKLTAIAAAGLLAAPLVCNAAPISYGALSSDDSGSTQIITDSLNNYEWLRWDVLADFSLEQTLAATSAGGLFQDWRIARNNEAQMFTNALLQGMDNACTITNSETCSMLLPPTLTGLFGDTPGSGTTEYVGFLSDEAPDLAGLIEYTHEGSFGSVYKSNDGGSTASLGWLLYRVGGSTENPPPTGVPEPGTLALLAAGLAGIGVFRRRRVS